MSELRPPIETKRKGGKGKYIAMGCAGVLLLAVVGGYFAVRGVIGFVSGVADQYAAREPLELPAVDVTDDQVTAVFDRVESFVESLEADGSFPAPLVLTSQDINTLIQRHPEWSELADKVYISIEEDGIHGQTSIPLDNFGGPFEGRYLNAAVVFRVELAEGRLLAFIERAEVAGQTLPASIMEGLRGRNLAEEANEDPEFTAMLEKLDSITVRDGSIAIVPKSVR